ncbi:MAG: hypothetical protein HFI34_09860 [Lachnospiraceae bacterium]|nr:hypothetical protein [Lachnospiraceae bacterium]
MLSVLRIYINIVREKFAKILAFIWTYTNPRYVKEHLLIRIKKFLTGLLDVKPRDKDDYYTVFKWMVSKKLAFAVVVFLGLVCIVYITGMKPVNIMGNSGKDSGILTYRYDAVPLRFHSGQVRILGKSGYRAYEGSMKDGVVEGKGNLYGKEGNLVYSGEFAQNMYNGTGKRYYNNQMLWYEGEFKDNEFSGTGVLYRDNGVKEYEGEFSESEKNGTGKLFDESGNPVFTGNFSSGELLYSDIPGKTTQEISDMYTGERIVYSSGQEFGVVMPDIQALYWGISGEDTLEETYRAGGVIVFKDTFCLQKRRFTTIPGIREYLGEPVYEGNTNLTLMECVAVNLLVDSGNREFEKIEMKSDSSFRDVIEVTDYDKTREIYIYSFENNGLLYTFYCTEKEGRFVFWKCEGV